MEKLIILLLFVSTSLFSQGKREEMRERIKSEKIAFITEKLELSSTEAKGFWPIYNAFEETIHTIKRKDLREIKNKMRKAEGLSKQEADNLLEQLIQAENNMHNAKLKMVNDLKKVISSEKIIRLKGAEDEFNRKILEKLREYRKNKPKKD